MQKGCSLTITGTKVWPTKYDTIFLAIDSPEFEPGTCVVIFAKWAGEY